MTNALREGTGVHLNGLVCRFGMTTALDGFSLDVAPGEFVALLGPSGCGKTTALRTLAGFETPAEGRVIVGGVDITSTAAQKRDMGMVFQSYSLFPNMSAIDNVAFGLQLRRVKGTDRKRRAGELLELVGLSSHATKYPHQLSGGQQQRVALARAIAIEPQVLLLDEPLSALDAKVRAELRDEIRFLQRRLNITTLFVTHDQEEALSMADRVCVMSNGKAEQIAAPATLYSRPSTAFVAEFVGVTSRIKASRSGEQVVVFDKSIKIRDDAAISSVNDVDVLLRPEDISVTASSTGLGIVTHTSFRGADTRLEVGVGGDTVRVDISSSISIQFPVGERVNLEVTAKDVLVSARR